MSGEVPDLYYINYQKIFFGSLLYKSKGERKSKSRRKGEGDKPENSLRQASMLAAFPLPKKGFTPDQRCTQPTDNSRISSNFIRKKQIKQTTAREREPLVQKRSQTVETRLWKMKKCNATTMLTLFVLKTRIPLLHNK